MPATPKFISLTAVLIEDTKAAHGSGYKEPNENKSVFILILNVG
jgi:hypothetical protein